jgi:hypothetical protein
MSSSIFRTGIARRQLGQYSSVAFSWLKLCLSADCSIHYPRRKYYNPKGDN